jgi:signal transduction histidine kinase
MTALPKPNPRLRLAVLFAIPLLFSIVFFVVNTVAERNDLQLIRLQSLNSGIGKLRSFANDAEVGIHGFLITGDAGYLATLEGVNSRLDSYVDLLGNRSSLDARLQRQLERLITLVQQRVDDANELLSLQRQQGFEAAFEEVKSGKSRQTMQQIRGLVDELQATVNTQVAGRLNRERYLTRWTFLVFLFGTLVMLVVLVWLYQSLLTYIDSRDRAVAQLKDLNLDLERRIGERTQELQHFNEELQQFAYVASHDLQEPLRTISTFTQLLQSRYKDRFDADAEEFMGYIVSSSRRMTDLINGLLALVRLRKSGQPAGPVSLCELLEEAKVSLQAAIRENYAEISSRNLPTLVVDRLQFAQVFQNLLANAIKYRREEAPRIVVEGSRESTHWTISIADNGRGFDQEFAERIFGLFQRLHAREVEGTGMGLSIVKRVVERHGGRIWANSTEGVGSVFYISLPVSLEARPVEVAGQSGMPSISVAP